MKTFSAIVLAASVVAVSPAHSGQKPKPPAEVQGVKLDSICTTCGVVSDIRSEPVKPKGSAQTTATGTAASGSSAGNEAGKKAKTLWSTTVTFKGGTTQTYQQTRNPGLRTGDIVTIEAGRPTKYVK
jgi:hypothetical protein